ASAAPSSGAKQACSVVCFADRAFDGGGRPPSYHERQSRQVTQAATIARLEAELKAERDKCVELTEKVE
ncbi:unnamed protein product, partial [Effrenium voratum]